MALFAYRIFFQVDINVFYINLKGYLGYFTYLFRWKLLKFGQKKKNCFQTFFLLMITTSVHLGS